MANTESEMRELWERLALEHPFYFVDDRLSYQHPDIEGFWARGREDLDTLLAAVDWTLDPDDTVVEVGAGLGRLTRGLAKRTAEVWAIDISERMLKLASTFNSDLDNVHWLRGDGVSLAGVADSIADTCVSHVVFQHIPDPSITLGYVREFGRVLRPGGVAAFQISNDPTVHLGPGKSGSLRRNLQALTGRGPDHSAHPAWLGSAVDLDDLHDAAGDAGMEIELVHGEGTQFCVVRARRRQDP